MLEINSRQGSYSHEYSLFVAVAPRYGDSCGARLRPQERTGPARRTLLSPYVLLGTKRIKIRRRLCILTFHMSLIMLCFNSSKIQRYSPTDAAKIHDRPLSRKNAVRFHPKQALDLLKAGPLPTEVDEEGKVALVQSYLDVSSTVINESCGTLLSDSLKLNY